MGSFFSKKKTFAKELADIEDKILRLEDYVSNARMTQHKVFVRIIIYSIVLEVMLALWIYLQTRSVQTTYGKLLYALYLLLFPLFIYISTKIFNFIYKKIIVRNEKKLESYKNELQTKIDERKKETDFENTQKLIDKYDKIMKKNNKPSAIGLKHRNVSTQTTPPLNTNINNTSNNNKVITQNVMGQQHQQVPTSSSSSSSSSYQYPITPETPPQSFSSPQRINSQPSMRNQPSSSSQSTSSPSSSSSSRQPIQQSIMQQGSPNNKQYQPGWLDKLVDYLISDGPKYGSPLICKKCHSHNGYVPTSEISNVQFRCRFCATFNQYGVSEEDQHTTPLKSNSSSRGNTTTSSVAVVEGVNQQQQSSHQKPTTVKLEKENEQDEESDQNKLVHDIVDKEHDESSSQSTVDEKEEEGDDNLSKSKSKTTPTKRNSIKSKSKKDN